MIICNVNENDKINLLLIVIVKCRRTFDAALLNKNCS